MALAQQTGSHPPASAGLSPSASAATQCLAGSLGAIGGEALGSSVPGKIVTGAVAAAIMAFLTAPGRHHRRRIVAVSLLLALLYGLRRAAGALAAERPRRPWAPASWSVVAATAVAGFAVGSAVTTVREGWATEPSTAEVTESRVTIPDVRGFATARAVAILRGAELRVSTRRRASAAVPVGTAIGTDPPARTEVDHGSRVRLLISDVNHPGPGTRVPPTGGGGETRVAVPEVAGLQRDAAADRLERLGLDAIPVEEPSERAAGLAIRTDPPARTQVPRGEDVTLVISSGPVVDDVTVPDVAGMAESEATAALSNAGLVTELTREPSASVAAGRVIRTDPAGGTTVERETTVTLVISSGPGGVE